MNTSKELLKIAKLIQAGDEWIDDKTVEFVKQLSFVMDRDNDVSLVKVAKNKIYFTFHIKMVGINLIYEIKEFGHGNDSESLNGDIRSDENHFFIPGGYTRTRDPNEMWEKGKKNLVEVFEMALKQMK